MSGFASGMWGFQRDDQVTAYHGSISQSVDSLRFSAENHLLLVWRVVGQSFPIAGHGDVVGSNKVPFYLIVAAKQALEISIIVAQPVVTIRQVPSLSARDFH